MSSILVRTTLNAFFKYEKGVFCVMGKILMAGNDVKTKGFD